VSHWAFPSKEQKAEFGNVVQLDLTNDGAVMAVARSVKPPAPCVQVVRLDDGSIIGELGAGTLVGGDVKRPDHYIAARGVAFAEDGRALYFALQPKGAGKRTLWRMTIADGNPVEVAKYENVHKLARNREGTLLAVIESRSIDIRTTGKKSETLLHVDCQGENPPAACFALDSKSVFIGWHEQEHVTRVDLKTGRVLERWPWPPGWVEQIALSPTGRYLVVKALAAGMMIYDLERKQRVYPGLYNEELSGKHFGFTPDGELLVSIWGATWNGFEFAIEDDIKGPQAMAQTVAAAWAWEDPTVAIATRDGFVRWVELEQQAPKKKR
jgi:hypothetical protein